MSAKRSYITIFILILGILVFWFWQGHGVGEPVKTFHGPKIQYWQTTKGVRVYFVASDQLPMVDLAVGFYAGSVYDQLPGQASLTNNLLGEGCRGLSTQETALIFDRIGAQFSHLFSRDVAGLKLRVLSDAKYLDLAVTTLAKVLGQPTFTPKAVTRVKQLMIERLRYAEQSPETPARRALLASLYPDHGYGHPPSGSIQSVDSLTQLAIQQHYARYYVANNAFIVMIGHLDRNKAEKIAEQITQHLPEGDKAPKPLLEKRASGQSHHIAFLSQQTHILMGQQGVNIQDPDYIALTTGNYVLGGGGLTSQLFKAVRDQRGLAYSVWSAFQSMRTGGAFLVGMQTRNSKADEAQKATLEVLKAFLQKGISKQQLQEAKEHLLLSYPLQFASNAALLNQLILIGANELPVDFINTYPAKIRGLTVEQVNDAFKRHINPDQLVVVTVGPGVDE